MTEIIPSAPPLYEQEFPVNNKYENKNKLDNESDSDSDSDNNIYGFNINKCVVNNNFKHPHRVSLDKDNNNFYGINDKKPRSLSLPNTYINNHPTMPQQYQQSFNPTMQPIYPIHQQQYQQQYQQQNQQQFQQYHQPIQQFQQPIQVIQQYQQPYQVFQPQFIPLNNVSYIKPEQQHSIQGCNRLTMSHKNLRINNLQNLINSYNIHKIYSDNLIELKNYDVVLLVDDSTTMNIKLNKSRNTRWDEFKIFSKMICDITNINNKLDIFFLNRDPIFSVKNYEKLEKQLNDKPYGRSPFKNTVKQIFTKYKHNDKPILLVIATNSIPTDNNGNKNLNNFIKLIKNRNSKFKISIISCSDNGRDNSILCSYDNINDVKILKNYIVEKKNITNKRGDTFNYSLGDHILRSLLLPICNNKEFQKENRMNTMNESSCIIL